VFGMIRTKIPQSLFAFVVSTAIVCAGVCCVSAQEDGEIAARDPASQILTLGDSPNSIYVVRHADRFSIFAEAVPADKIFEAMEPLGGPRYEYSTDLTRPVTLTMHEVSIEQIVRKMLEGHSFTYHYADGRLALVRVLPFITGRNYKTPPALESRSRWTEIELDLIASRDMETDGSRPGIASGKTAP
jgi:hypothetical protein